MEEKEGKEREGKRMEGGGGGKEGEEGERVGKAWQKMGGGNKERWIKGNEKMGKQEGRRERER